jgi:hypothetical protein
MVIGGSKNGVNRRASVDCSAARPIAAAPMVAVLALFFDPKFVMAAVGEIAARHPAA